MNDGFPGPGPQARRHHSAPPHAGWQPTPAWDGGLWRPVPSPKNATAWVAASLGVGGLLLYLVAFAFDSPLVMTEDPGGFVSGLLGLAFGIPALVCGILGVRSLRRPAAVTGIVCGALLILTLPLSIMAGIGRQGGTAWIDADHGAPGGCQDRHVEYTLQRVGVGTNFTHRHTDYDVVLQVRNVGSEAVSPYMVFVYHDANWTTLDVENGTSLQPGQTHLFYFHSGTYDPEVVVWADTEPRFNGLGPQTSWTDLGLKYDISGKAPVASMCDISHDNAPEDFLA